MIPEKNQVLVSGGGPAGSTAVALLAGVSIEGVSVEEIRFSGERPVAANGAIAVGSIAEGWLWAIPFSDGTMSVGAVIQKDAFKEQHEDLTVSGMEDIADAEQCAHIEVNHELRKNKGALKNRKADAQDSADFFDSIGCDCAADRSFASRSDR